MKVTWPDMMFPPINLYTAPRMQTPQEKFDSTMQEWRKALVAWAIQQEKMHEHQRQH